MAVYTHKNTGNTMDVSAKNAAAYAAAGWTVFVPVKKIKPVEPIFAPPVDEFIPKESF
jgi:hypothetical protein